MRTILDVLRLRLDAGPSERHTARSLGVPRTTVQDYLARFCGSGLAWPLAPHLDDAALESALFARDPALPAASRPLPNWTAIAREKKRKGVTLHLLWQEYRSVERAGYSYSQFAEYVILDVKTGGTGGQPLEERMSGYTRQVQTYVSATETISGTPVDRFIFAFGQESGTDVREIRVEGDLRETMMNKLRVAIEQLPKGGQTLASDPKTCRSCGYRRVGWCAGVK